MLADEAAEQAAEQTKNRPAASKATDERCLKGHNQDPGCYGYLIEYLGYVLDLASQTNFLSLGAIIVSPGQVLDPNLPPYRSPLAY